MRNTVFWRGTTQEGRRGTEQRGPWQCFVSLYNQNPSQVSFMTIPKSSPESRLSFFSSFFYPFIHRSCAPADASIPPELFCSQSLMIARWLQERGRHGERQIKRERDKWGFAPLKVLLLLVCLHCQAVDTDLLYRPQTVHRVLMDETHSSACQSLTLGLKFDSYVLMFESLVQWYMNRNGNGTFCERPIVRTR